MSGIGCVVCGDYYLKITRTYKPNAKGFLHYGRNDKNEIASLALAMTVCAGEEFYGDGLYSSTNLSL